MKRIVSIVLAAALLIAAVAGCSKKDDPDLGASTPKPSATPAPQTDDATTPEPEDEGTQYDYAKVTWFFNEGGIVCPPDAYQCVKALEEINVEYVPINPSGTEYESILLSMLASGEQIDVMGTWKDFQIQLLKDGLIQPVDDYLNTDYLPNLIRVSRVWEPALNTMKLSDGKIYAIPSVKNNALPDQYDWIRKDWLDAVGKDVPTNFDELTDVLIAFAQGNPNGDNVNYYANMFNELWGFGWIFEAYSASYNRWYIGEDGLPELGLLTPRVKEVLAYVKNLIDNKATNEDVMTTQYDQIGEKIKAGVVGYHHGWSDYNAWDEMLKIYPDAEWIPIEPIQSPYYDKGYASYERTTDFTRDQWSISSKCKDIDAVMRLMDWMCVDTATSKDPDSMTYEGSYWYAFGERGVNYDIYNNKFVGGGSFPENQELADKFQAQNEVDKWAGWAMRKFQNVYDTRWMGTIERDKELKAWQATLPTGNDIPASNPLLVRTWLEPMDEATETQYNEFYNVFGDLDSSAKFAEIIGYPAILGKGDIDTLYNTWLDMANAAGYQEVRQLVADHMEMYPFEY